MVENVSFRPESESPISRRLLDFLSANFVWVLVLALSFVAYLINPVFYSMGNLYTLLVTLSGLGRLTPVEGVVLLTRNLDSSIGFTMIFAAMVAAWLTIEHTYASGWQLPAEIGILSTLAVGILVGAVNG